MTRTDRPRRGDGVRAARSRCATVSLHLTDGGIALLFPEDYIG